MLSPPVQQQFGPHDIQVEQELLGCLLLYTHAYQLVHDIIRVEDFFEPLHQQIFDIVSKLSIEGKPATPTTVKSFIPDDFVIWEDMTVSKYLIRLAASSTTLITARDFATIIRDLADYRAIISIVETAALINGIDYDPSKAASDAIDRLDAIVSKRLPSGLPAMTMPQTVTRAVDAAAVAYQNEGKLLGMSFGLADLDAKLLGAQRGHLMVIAARPSMGKSALALCLARNMAKFGGYYGVFYSLEMGDVELSQRLISDEMFDDGRMTYWQIRSGRFHESVFQRITEAAERISVLPLVIEQQPGLSVSQIAARARQRKRRGKLDFIVVDHLGLVAPSGRYTGSRVTEIGEMTAALKGLAKELDCAVILLAQLNRAVEGREDKRPRLADLRESGSIEQDADVVIMLYRRAYYLERSEPAAGSSEYLVWQTEMENCHNELQCLVEKNRSGPIGMVRCFVDIGCNAVRSWANSQPTEEMA